MSHTKDNLLVSRTSLGHAQCIQSKQMNAMMHVNPSKQYGVEDSRQFLHACFICTCLW